MVAIKADASGAGRELRSQTIGGKNRRGKELPKNPDPVVVRLGDEINGKLHRVYGAGYSSAYRRLSLRDLIANLQECRHDVKRRSLRRKYCGHHGSRIQYELSGKIRNGLVGYGVVRAKKPLGDTNPIEFFKNAVDCQILA